MRLSWTCGRSAWRTTRYPAPAVAAQLREPDRVAFLRALQTLLLPPPWHSGRVVLVGDAAHATSPQALAFGIGLAIEDAVVLADLLRSEPELSDALGTFTERRFPRCRLVVENSAGSVSGSSTRMLRAPIRSH